MADEPRQLRTQAERDADGTTWRNRYATVDDIQRAMRLIAAMPPPIVQCRMSPTAARWMAAHASVKPRALGGPPPALLGIPIIEDADLPYGEWRLLDANGHVVKRGRFDQPHGPEVESTPRPPRRRWWHRYTRRNP